MRFIQLHLLHYIYTREKALRQGIFLARIVYMRHTRRSIFCKKTEKQMWFARFLTNEQKRGRS